MSCLERKKEKVTKKAADESLSMGGQISAKVLEFARSDTKRTAQKRNPSTPHPASRLRQLTPDATMLNAFSFPQKKKKN